MKINNTHDHMDFPVPPSSLIDKFVGKQDPKLYLQSATQFPIIVNKLLNMYGLDLLKDFDQLLDFGCGAGRLLRDLPAYTNGKICGTDLDGEAIDFCIKSLPFGHFRESSEFPDSFYETNQFDFLYAFSVLTHLSVKHQDIWLQEWSKIVSTNAILFVTYKSERLLHHSNYTDEQIEIAKNALLKDGIMYKKTDFWKGKFPEFYQGAFHTDEYVKDHWGKIFEVVDLVPAGKYFAQDLAILKNR